MQGLYDFWANRRIKAEDILSAHTASVVERASQQERVLLIQDTTELDYSKHNKQGIGYLSGKGQKGLKVHSTLCTSLSGVPLGLVEQKVWAREQNRRTQGYNERKKAIEDRESIKWLESLESSQQKLPDTVKTITVADREADIYRFLIQHQQLGADFIIRSYQKRNSILADTGENASVEPLSELIHKQPIWALATLNLQRTPKRKQPRKAELTIRHATVELQPPQHTSTPEENQPLRVQVILAEEINPPETETPVSWLLLTSLEINDPDQAEECLQIYTKRWLIERYHYTLKSGCNIEKLQLKRADRIHRALATYSIVAWRLLWLTYTSRENPNQPATVAFTLEEWKSLYCVIHKDTIGKTTPIPDKPPSIHQCVKWIAQLGGFLGRKGDGEPGVKTLWLGLQRLKDITSTWVMTRELQIEEVLAA